MQEQNIFQILITDDDQSVSIPADVEENFKSIRQNYPQYKYNRLNGSELESFIDANFDADTLSALKCLRPYTFKADLGRFCLLFIHGGIYADVAIRMIRPMTLPNSKKMMCFRDTPGTGLWTVSTSLIASEARRDELKLAIDLIKSNVSTQFYGGNSLCPTGPSLFGRALAITNRLHEIEFGSFDFLTNDRNPHNLGHVDGTGRIVSLRWKSGSFRNVGIPGTNDYTDMWNRRIVYGETRRRFEAESLSIYSEGQGYISGVSRHDKSIIFNQDAVGCIVYGPYIPMDAGNYNATFHLPEHGPLDGMLIDVIGHRFGGVDILASRLLNNNDKNDISISFSMSTEVDQIEVRLLSNGGSKGVISHLEILDLVDEV